MKVKQQRVSSVGTYTGGFITILYAFFVMSYAVSQFYLMVTYGSSTIRTYDIISDIDKEFRLSDYSDTLNMVIGCNNKTVDPLNNPYYRIKAHKMDQDYQFTKEFKLKKCEHSDFDNLKK